MTPRTTWMQRFISWTLARGLPKRYERMAELARPPASSRTKVSMPFLWASTSIISQARANVYAPAQQSSLSILALVVVVVVVVCPLLSLGSFRSVGSLVEVLIQISYHVWYSSLLSGGACSASFLLLNLLLSLHSSLLNHL